MYVGASEVCWYISVNPRRATFRDVRKVPPHSRKKNDKIEYFRGKRIYIFKTSVALFFIYSEYIFSPIVNYLTSRESTNFLFYRTGNNVSIDRFILAICFCKFIIINFSANILFFT